MVTTHVLAFFRMQGLSSMAGYLPIGDANAITLEIGERYLANVVPDCPVMAGILCGDPTRDMRRFVHTLVDAGFVGIMNCPTVALIDGQYRKDLEETGLGYQHEIDILGYASSQEIYTKAFATTPDEALAMAEAGVDNMIVHFGNSSGGTIGSQTVMALDDMVTRTVAIVDALFGQIRRPHRHRSWRRHRSAQRLRRVVAPSAAARRLYRRFLGRALSH